MHYIRERFWRGYQYTTIRQGNRDMREWLDTIASTRIHGTTRIPAGKGKLAADQRFYTALKKDKEQARRKYRVPSNKKGKATRGLLKHGLRHETVQRRPLSDYEELIGGAQCLN